MLGPWDFRLGVMHHHIRWNVPLTFYVLLSALPTEERYIKEIIHTLPGFC